MWQHNICLNCDQKGCIVIACDNMYIMESKDEFVFVDFLFIQYLLLFAINVSCDLSKATNEILVAKLVATKF